MQSHMEVMELKELMESRELMDEVLNIYTEREVA